VVVQDRVARPWLLFNWIYNFTDDASEELLQKKRLDDFTRNMIHKRRDMVVDGQIEGRKSLLDYMIEISKKHPDFNEDDIINEACTFMLAVSVAAASQLSQNLITITLSLWFRAKTRSEHRWRSPFSFSVSS
jgi:cytochrome P450 family 4